MLILLSPAKTLDLSPAPEELPATRPRFAEDAAVLMQRCKELGVEELQVLMKLSRNLAELNHERFQKMEMASDPSRGKAALLAFQGDVYRKLDVSNLSEADLRWAQGRIRILSGLYGLLRPFDLIQPYRLEMGTRLANPRGANLYDFWGDRLARALDEEEVAQGGRAILNLASLEYAKAVPTAALQAPLITARFQEVRDGELRTIGFSAKRARGLTARFVIRERIEDPEALRRFDAEGYRFQPDLSSPDGLLFVRDRAA